MHNDNMNNKIKTEIAIGIILILAVMLGGIFYLINKQPVTLSPGNQLSQRITNETSVNSVQTKTPQLNCQKDWREYYQNTLGIAFCYPIEWGEPTTDPIKNITNISNMKETFETQNIYYENALNINFEKNNQIHIRLFNDQYSGKSQRDINEPTTFYDSGTTDDVVSLRNGGSICNYKIGYNYAWNNEMEMNPDTLKTIYSDCANGVKVALTQNKEFFNFNNIGALYTYDLRLLSFKKLANGYFDNVLVSRVVDRANQIHEELGTLDEFFTGNKTTQVENGFPIKTKEQFSQERKEFEQFSNTITAFRPVPKTQSEFEQISGEDPNITIIRKYYWLITNGKLDQAYAMYSQKPADFSTYQTWYKNAMKADPRDFKNKGDNSYEFYVDYQEHNNTPTIYHATMQVVNSQLKTIASEEITSAIVSFGPYTAFTKNIGDQNYIVLTENGKEIIIDKAGNDFEKQGIGQVKIFHDPKFSPSGRYLKYLAGGWEWSGTSIYDVKEKKQVAGMDGPEKLGFTEGDKYVYGCMSPGMGGGTGVVFSLPDGKKVFDVSDQKELEQYTNFDCEYTKDKNYITFTLKQDLNGSSDVKPLPDKIFKFNLKN